MLVPRRREAPNLVFWLDVAGTFTFAVEGASRAIGAELDLLGVLVLAFATALGGGIVRDVLLGATPPSSIRDGRYPAIAFTAGLIAFLARPAIGALDPHVLVVLDAIGLSLFAVAGAEKALQHGMGPLVAILMGATTGCGGGLIADVLLSQVPRVLTAEIYAGAAIAGATALIVASRAGLRPGTASLVGGLVCLTIRLVAYARGWSLPHAPT